MGLIGNIVNKIKGGKKEPTAEEKASQKIEGLKNLLSSINQKSFQIKRMTSVYQQQIEKCLNNVKQNPNNQYLINTTRNTLKYLIAKKNAYEKFGALIEATKMQVETKYTEASLTNGEEIIDAKFCSNIEKLYTACDDYTNMINDANTLAGLENIMKIASDSLGVVLESDSEDEIDSMLNDARGIKNEPKVKKEETKETVKEETNNDKALEDIRKSIK